MAEESNNLNLDLNLEPLDPHRHYNNDGSIPAVSFSVENFLDSDAHELMDFAHQIRRRLNSPWMRLPPSPENQSPPLDSVTGSEAQIDQVRVLPEERPTEAPKICESRTGFSEDEGLNTKNDTLKNTGDEGGFFDCNICLDVAKEPVVTCCGHLFCWPCLYRWLHLHSSARNCPVCKGDVGTIDVTPIYGRGNDKRVLHTDSDSALAIPLRPRARRRETVQRTPFPRAPFPLSVDEMIQRLENTYSLSGHLAAQMQSRNSEVDSVSREAFALYHLVSTIRRSHNGDQTPVVPENDSIEPRVVFSETLPVPASSGPFGFHRRGDLGRAPLLSNFTPERNQDLDRDSVSSRAAVIHSEGQTVDNTDSTVARSTLSSRRGDGSRLSDADTGDSRAPRRRRLN